MTSPGGTDSHAPSGWHESRLGDLARIRRGASPRPIDNPRWFAENGPGWVRISDVTKAAGHLRSTEQYLSQDGVERSVRIGMGDVIMSICATIGEPVIVEMDACIHDGFVVFDQFENSLDRQFLLHLLRKIAPEFKASGQTGTQANLNTGIVNGKTVRIPRSTSEQSRIAAVLDTVDEAIAKTEAVTAKLRQVRAGLLHDLLTRGLDEHGQLRDPIAHPDQFQDSPLGRIPINWSVKELKDCYAVPSRNGLYKKATYYGSGHRMIHMPQMFKDIRVDVADAVRVAIEAEELQSYSLDPGDLLFARRSLNLEGAGLSSIVPALDEPVTFESSIVRVRLDQNIILPGFAVEFLRSELGYLLRRPFIRQVAVSGVSSEDIGHFLVPCPKPDEQGRILTVLDSYDHGLRLYEAELRKLVHLKSGLMTDLLTGRVRVPEGVAVAP
jgi:type I restriction enzyme S subunit